MDDKLYRQRVFCGGFKLPDSVLEDERGVLFTVFAHGDQQHSGN